MASIKTLLLRYETSVTWKTKINMNDYFYKQSTAQYKLRNLLQNLLWTYKYLLVSSCFVFTTTKICIFFNYMAFAHKRLTRNKKSLHTLLKTRLSNYKRSKDSITVYLATIQQLKKQIKVLSAQSRYFTSKSGFNYTNSLHWLVENLKVIKYVVSPFLSTKLITYSENSKRRKGPLNFLQVKCIQLGSGSAFGIQKLTEVLRTNYIYKAFYNINNIAKSKGRTFRSKQRRYSKVIKPISIYVKKTLSSRINVLKPLFTIKNHSIFGAAINSYKLFTMMKHLKAPTSKLYSKKLKRSIVLKSFGNKYVKLRTDALRYLYKNSLHRKLTIVRVLSLKKKIRKIWGKPSNFLTNILKSNKQSELITSNGAKPSVSSQSLNQEQIIQEKISDKKGYPIPLTNTSSKKNVKRNKQQINTKISDKTERSSAKKKTKHSNVNFNTTNNKDKSRNFSTKLTKKKRLSAQTKKELLVKETTLGLFKYKNLDKNRLGDKRADTTIIRPIKRQKLIDFKWYIFKYLLAYNLQTVLHRPVLLKGQNVLQLKNSFLLHMYNWQINSSLPVQYIYSFFFQKDLTNVLICTMMLRSSNLLSFFLARLFEKIPRHSWFFHIFNRVMSVFKFYCKAPLSLKVLIKGRIDKKLRKQTLCLLRTQVAMSTISSHTDYSLNHSYTSASILGIKVWVVSHSRSATVKTFAQRYKTY